MTITELFRKAIMSLSGISQVLKELYNWSHESVATKESVQQELTNKATKQNVTDAQSAIIGAINSKPVTPATDLTPVTQVLGSYNSSKGTIQDQIGNIVFDKNGLATDAQANEIIGDVSGLPGELNAVLESVSGITGYAYQGSGSSEDVNLTVVDNKIGDVQEVIDTINGGTMDINIPSDYVRDTTVTSAKTEILSAITAVSGSVGVDNSGVTVHEKVDTIEAMVRYLFNGCSIVENSDDVGTGNQGYTVILDQTASINDGILTL
jgi:hypothetical protein